MRVIEPNDPSEITRAWLATNKLLYECIFKNKKTNKTKMGGSSSSSSQHTFTAYVYVPLADVVNIKRNGYWSARTQIEKAPLMGSGLVLKYAKQLKAARRMKNCEPPTLLQYFEEQDVVTPVEETLAYLRWRLMPEVEDGDKAIYFLFAPIPESVQVYARPFLRGRELLEIQVPCDAALYLIANHEHNYTPKQLRSFSNKQWTKIWHEEMERAPVGSAEYADRLWLENIPHALFVPPEGLVKAKCPSSNNKTETFIYLHGPTNDQQYVAYNRSHLFRL
jgi:hypothetical protein